MSVKGKVIDIWAPNFYGFFIKGIRHIADRIWSLKFKCGQCGAKSTVQHNESKNWHKCPACKTINILNKTSYYDIYG